MPYPNIPPPNYGGQGMMNQRRLDQKIGTYTGAGYKYTGAKLFGVVDFGNLEKFTTQQRNLVAMDKARSELSWNDRFRGYGQKSHFMTLEKQRQAYTQSAERAKAYHEERLDAMYGGSNASIIGTARHASYYVGLEGAFDKTFGRFNLRRGEQSRTFRQSGAFLEDIMRRRDVFDARSGSGIGDLGSSQKRFSKLMTSSDALARASGMSNADRTRLERTYGWQKGMTGQYQSGLFTQNERMQLGNFMAQTGQMRGVSAIYEYDSSGKKVVSSRDMSSQEKKKRIETAAAGRITKAAQGMETLAELTGITDKEELTEMSYILSEGMQHRLKPDELRKMEDIVEEVGFTIKGFTEILKQSDEQISRMGLTRSQGKSMILSSKRRGNFLQSRGFVGEDTVLRMGGQQAYDDFEQALGLTLGGSDIAKQSAAIYAFREQATSDEDIALADKMIKNLRSGSDSRYPQIRTDSITALQKLGRKDINENTLDRNLRARPVAPPIGVDIGQDFLIDEISEFKKTKLGRHDILSSLKIRMKTLNMNLDKMDAQFGGKLDAYLLNYIDNIKKIKSAINVPNKKSTITNLTKLVQRIRDEYGSLPEGADPEAREKQMKEDITSSLRKLNVENKTSFTSDQIEKLVPLTPGRTKKGIQDAVKAEVLEAKGKSALLGDNQGINADAKNLLYGAKAKADLSKMIDPAFKPSNLNEKIGLSSVKAFSQAFNVWKRVYDEGLPKDLDSTTNYKRDRDRLFKQRALRGALSIPGAEEKYPEEFKKLKAMVRDPSIDAGIFQGKIMDLDSFRNSLQDEAAEEKRIESLPEEERKLVRRQNVYKKQMNKMRGVVEESKRGNKKEKDKMAMWNDASTWFAYSKSGDAAETFKRTFGVFANTGIQEGFQKKIDDMLETGNTSGVKSLVKKTDIINKIMKIRDTDQNMAGKKADLQQFSDDRGYNLNVDTFTKELDPYTNFSPAEKFAEMTLRKGTSEEKENLTSNVMRKFGMTKNNANYMIDYTVRQKLRQDKEQDFGTEGSRLYKKLESALINTAGAADIVTKSFKGIIDVVPAVKKANKSVSDGWPGWITEGPR